MNARAISAMRWVSRIGLAGFVAAIALLHILSPEVDPRTQGISYYAHGQHPGVLLAAFQSLALGVLSLIVLLASPAPSRPATLAIGILLLWTGLMESAAWCPMDSPGAAPTLAGRIHMAAGLGVFLLPLAAFLLARGRTGRDLMPWGVLGASVVLVVFNGAWIRLGVGGLFQRGYWVLMVAWWLRLGCESPHARTTGREGVTTSSTR